MGEKSERGRSTAGKAGEKRQRMESPIKGPARLDGCRDVVGKARRALRESPRNPKLTYQLTQITQAACSLRTPQQHQQTSHRQPPSITNTDNDFPSRSREGRAGMKIWAALGARARTVAWLTAPPAQCSPVFGATRSKQMQQSPPAAASVSLEPLSLASAASLKLRLAAPPLAMPPPPACAQASIRFRESSRRAMRDREVYLSISRHYMYTLYGTPLSHMFWTPSATAVRCFHVLGSQIGSTESGNHVWTYQNPCRPI